MSFLSVSWVAGLGASEYLFYRPSKGAVKLRDDLVAPLKALFEQEPACGYPHVGGLLGIHKTPSSAFFTPKAAKSSNAALE